MEPTLFVGDLFVSDKTYYRHVPVGRDDLVVMRRKGYVTVKRVIAIGGDTIEAKNRQVLVNGQLVDERFIQHSRPAGTDPEMDSFGPIAVPEGKYFVMGDNRDVSLDSRMSEFGLLDVTAIVGKPLYIFWSATKTRRGKELN
jgi:signal peptidase I